MFEDQTPKKAFLALYYYGKNRSFNMFIYVTVEFFEPCGCEKLFF